MWSDLEQNWRYLIFHAKKAKRAQDSRQGPEKRHFGYCAAIFATNTLESLAFPVNHSVSRSRNITTQQAPRHQAHCPQRLSWFEAHWGKPGTRYHFPLHFYIWNSSSIWPFVGLELRPSNPFCSQAPSTHSRTQFQVVGFPHFPGFHLEMGWATSCSWGTSFVGQASPHETYHLCLFGGCGGGNRQATTLRPGFLCLVGVSTIQCFSSGPSHAVAFSSWIGQSIISHGTHVFCWPCVTCVKPFIET